MSSITTRAAKGSALTHAEVDANFTNLNSGKAEVSGQTFTGSVTLPAGSATAAGVKVGTGTTYAPGLYSPGTDQLAISTAGLGRLFVDGSGRVGIGSSSAPGGLDSRVWIDQAGTNDYGLLINASGGVKQPTLWFRDASATLSGKIVGQSGLTLTTTNSSATGALNIDTSQRVLVGTTSAVSAGAKLQTTDGLTFPAAQVASADPNTLDDYEEGTFTPTVIGSTTAGTATYTTQNGRYTKTGRMVQIELYIVWSGGTGTGYLLISGLPFTSANSVTYPALAVASVDNLALTANNYPNAYVSNNASTILIVQTPIGGGGVSSTVPYDSAAAVAIAGCYTV